MMSSKPNSDSPAEPDDDAASASPGADQAAGRKFPGATDNFGLQPKPRVKVAQVDPLLGIDLGGVKIVRLLGEGGMGRVYEARQESPPRTVAVKVIRQGITSEKTMRRFEREAEFLGKLQHPGIAEIYVVGSYTSDSGDVPFFVMEYIQKAKPITNYVQERGLSVRDKLRLFKQVCEAVSHGHDRGIVHRDLKPGNILIDAAGAPKVIDFGVARSTDSDFSLTSMKTDTGQLVGTVQYMSPEQFGDSPEGLDGRADVYSLGVVLYELIAGVLPYEVRKKKMHEAARIVCEFMPPTLRSHGREIPREVSLIAERCLHKNRRDRYQTAGALVDDIQRYLDGRPIRRSFRGVLAGLRRQACSRPARIGLAVAAVAAIAGITIMLDRLGRTQAGLDGQPPTESREGSVPARAVPVLPAPPEPFISDAGLKTNPVFSLEPQDPQSVRGHLWDLVDENLAAMTAHDMPGVLATMSREMPQRDLFIQQCEKDWALAGMHYRLDALEVVEHPDWPPPYAVARVTLTIRDPSPGAPGDKVPPDELSHIMLLRTKTPTTVSEWLFKREAGGWKIVANLTAPEPAEPPGEAPARGR